MLEYVAISNDHHEAPGFCLRPDNLDEATLTASPRHAHHEHPKGSAGAGDHPDDAKRFATVYDLGQ